LLRLADHYKDERFVDRAGKCVRFLLSVQLGNGAFPGAEIADNRVKPSPFNSAQIIHGLVAWHKARRDEAALEAAIRAADWLVSVQDDDGAFREHYYLGVPATYSSHATCWLAELGELLGEQKYLEACRRHLVWLLGNVDEETGWFDFCGFNETQHQARTAFTHTIAYTIFGVLFTSLVLADAAGIAAAKRAADAVLRRTELSRGLPGVLNYRWRSCADYTCLTGNAQMALIWFKLFELERDPRYLNTALVALDQVRRAQPMKSPNPGIRGGIAGSYPIWGQYIQWALPNWAAKYYIDALLEEKKSLGDAGRLETLSGEGAREDIRLPAVKPAQTDPPPLTIVWLTSRGSQKARRMLQVFGQPPLQPAAMLVERPKPESAVRALWRILQADGFSAAVRKVIARMGLSPGPQSGQAQETTTLEHECREKGIRLRDVGSVNEPDALEILRELKPDIVIHAGAGILKAEVLQIPRLGTINAHMGRLPYYRGVNVAEWAVLNRDKPACSVHLIDRGIDTGSIIATRTVAVGGLTTIEQLRDAVDDAQLLLLAEVLTWIHQSREIPPLYSQSPEQGRQHFRMHAALKRVVLARLSGTA
jgi:folate-dependent phosphoribosylglycinamide formyltransferase PurN